jgi:glutamate-1-semialdehyde 2,1-aminomutase
VLVDLAEALVDVISDAEWILFGKNGTDATTACLTIARAHTSRSVILVARGFYHGAAPWCSPVSAGTLPSDRAAMAYFEYNDQADFDRAVEAAGSDLAGVMLTPFRHVEGEDQELVDVDFARHVRRRALRVPARVRRQLGTTRGASGFECVEQGNREWLSTRRSHRP